MACEVHIKGHIKNLQKAQEFFGLSHDENWLNSVMYSISPSSELIALGLGEKLAFFSSVWDNKTQNMTYTLSWCGELEDPNQIITALLCMPIYGKGVSSGSEWTCVSIGLASGMVLFYTDAGIKIFSQSYHEEQVLSVRAYSPPRRSESESFVYVVYDECICIIKGSDVFPLLNNMRYNVHRAMGRSLSRSTLETTDVLQYNKFKFSRQHEMIVNDAVVAGQQQARTYDHIIEQCLIAGFYAKVSEKPVQSSLVLGVGAEPYMGFYYAEEGYKTISLTEVAKDVIGVAYRNLLGNFFRGGSEQQTTEEQQSPSKESKMRTRCKIFDGKRDGFHVVISPNGRLAAVTDNLDRVMLVDTQRCNILRVFKGYRDAQCGFICVKEKLLKGPTQNQGHRRRALFLVIYAPRLGCLEIWALQNGPKVAAFTVSKSGQLIYNTHGLLGAPAGSKTKISVSQCFFLDSSDASVKEIQIPFHFALSEMNSKTSRDIHLLRRLKNLLRDHKNEQNFEDISELASEFQTIEVRQQCLEMLKKNRQLRPEIFRTIIQAFVESFNAEILASGLQPIDEIKSFQIAIQNYKRLADFYIAMKSPSKTEFDEQLELCESDQVIISQLIMLMRKSRKSFQADEDTLLARVTFQENCQEDGDFVDYLSIFEINHSGIIPLNTSKSDSYGDVSCKLFDPFLTKGLNFEEFKIKAEESLIPSEDLLILSLYYWLEKPFKYNDCEEVINDLTRLAAVITAICELAGECVNDYAYNAISPWWQNVREMLLTSPKSLGLLVAIACKTVAMNLWKRHRDGSCDEASQTEDGDEERWERISHDEAQWSLLIGKLEDVAVLGAVLEHPITSCEIAMPEISFDPPDCSLKLIINGGRGIVCDLTSQWLINSRIHPKYIVELDKSEAAVENENECEKSTIEEDKNEENCGTQIESQDPVIERLNLLRKHFPFSLESGMLLSQMAWHYMVHWSKNLQSLQHMKAAIVCLEQFKTTDLNLKHGMCCLLWNATLKFPLQSTMKLIQKVGRLPTDKMCQQDIEMSAVFVPEFLDLTLKFFEHFETSMHHESREIRFEEILVEGQLPLQFIALQQHHAIKELLQLHRELCTVLHFITFFQLKVHKPITTVFDAVSNKVFFADINKELLFVLPAPDLVLQQLRTDFLCKVIAASMDLIREDTEDLYIDEHVHNMESVMNLANSWQLNPEPLKHEEIIQLYAHGYDVQAESLLKKVNDIEEVGPALLEIAGRRLNLYIRTTQKDFLKVASVGQQLMQFLDKLHDGDLNRGHTVSNKITTETRTIQISETDPSEIKIIPLKKLIVKSIECLSKRDPGSSTSTVSRLISVGAQMFDACSLL